MEDAKLMGAKALLWKGWTGKKPGIYNLSDPQRP